MNTRHVVTFTEWERDFLLDRLEADVVAGVLLDTYDIDEDTAESAVDLVRDAVDDGSIDLDMLDVFAQEALRDAIDGSTWFARLSDAVDDGETTRQKYTADLRRLDALIEKLSAHGFEVDQPNRE